MSRIFITGSSEGLGLMTGQLLAEGGHEVVLHARNEKRAADARQGLPQASAVVVGDVSSIAGCVSVGEQVNRLGVFDAVIHNVAVGYREPKLLETADGLPHVFATNVLAPYLLTVLISRPKRLVYLSSGLHRTVAANLDDALWRKRRWNGSTAYSESKLYDVMLAFAFSRLWPDVLSNALEPGWVSTRMGGAGATDDLSQGHLTQAWLAVSEDAAAKVSGQYFYHMQRRDADSQATDIGLQDRLLALCEQVSGIGIPR